MHFAQGEVPLRYTRYIERKCLFIVAGLLLLAAAVLVSISQGAVAIPLSDVVRSLIGAGADARNDIIIWNIRLPQALAAVAAGGGLAVSGAVMQSILRNPLGSPYTLGISQAAAFGAALAVMVFNTGVMASTQVGAVTISQPIFTTATAFVFCLTAAAVIIAISRLRGASPETMILTGVALGALFTAGTMFLQFFADDVQLAAMVFWTFGDVGRASWSELGLFSGVTALSAAYFLINSWNYNAVDAGDETAQGLGVRVERVRLIGMLVASLVTAVIVAFLGIIGFVGLVCPHMVRRLIGGDHRYLLPATVIVGGFLLLVSDTVARLIIAPHLLPVSILTAFMGAPAFIYLLIRGYRR